MRFNQILFKLLLLIMATPLLAGESLALNGGAGISASNGTVTTNSTSTNFISNASSLSCSSSAGKLIVDSTADTLSYCSSGGSTVKYAALGNDNGEATSIAALTIDAGDIQAGVIPPSKMTESFMQSYAGTGLTFDTTTSPDSLKIAANGVTLATDTQGNYVATIAGTSNEITVSGSGSEDAAVTVSLPSTIDIGGKTSFEIPNAASPTVNVFGQIAGDNNLWGASRGAVVAYDGTASTALVGTLVSDTPADKQAPQYNTGGTITWEYTGGNVDARNFGVVCDGSTSDQPALDSAYTAVNGYGGGTIIIKNTGSACMIGADVTVKSNVSLICEPGVVLKATAGYAVTNGMFTGTSVSKVKIEGCTFDLNTRKGPALKTTGEDIIVKRNYFFNGDISEASDWNIVDYGCGTNGSSPASSICEVANNRIECASSSAGVAKDVGLNTTGSTDSGQKQHISNNQVIGCDSYAIKTSAIADIVSNGITATSFGISASAIETSISNNRIIVSGAAGIGISSTGVRGSINGNKVQVSGSTAIGIKNTGATSGIYGNAVLHSGAGGSAIWTNASSTQIIGNAYALTSNTAGAGNDTTVGVQTGDGSGGVGVSIVGNTGSIGSTDSQTHVNLAMSQTAISGNFFSGGKYCVAPSQVSYTEWSSVINSNITGNRCYAQSGAAIVANTGFIITGNYLAWLGTSGTAVIEAGDNRTIQGTVVHLNITGNLIHISPSSTAAGVKINSPGKLCADGTLIGQSCTVNGDCTGGTTCAPASGLAHVQISGNHFYVFVNGHGSSVDINNGITSASGDVSNIVIDGNTFNTASTQSNSVAAITCNTSYSSKISNIVIGTNSYDGYAPVNGDTSDGRVSLGCTPSMVKDVDTSYLWLPAAGCNGSTAYPVFDMPTSSAPTATCSGSNQPRGFLSFADGATSTAYLTFSLPGNSTYQFFFNPLYTVNASNNLSTMWGFTAKCLGNDDPTDGTWSETEYTSLTAFGSLTALDFRNTSANQTVNAFACAKDLVTLRIQRIGANGSDTQTSASLLYGIQAWIRKQN